MAALTLGQAMRKCAIQRTLAMRANIFMVDTPPESGGRCGSLCIELIGSGPAPYLVGACLSHQPTSLLRE